MFVDAVITLLIVDDHPVVREGLNSIISAQASMKVVGNAATAAGAVTEYVRVRPDVVLMDLLLPDGSGVEAIRQIYDRAADARVIVLTSAGGDEDIYRALEAGARGYLQKDMVTQYLLEAIHQVYAGRRYIPAEIGATIARNLPRHGLTLREIEVLRHIASGLRNKEIAYSLKVSEGTVNVHVKNILSKLSATDRTQAVVVALRRGILRM